MTTTSPNLTPESVVTDERRGHRDTPLSVPYVTAWSAEELDNPDLIVRPGNRGIAYRDETPYDRDERAILLKRTPDAPGRGKPRFGIVHATRQRRAMRDLLCQVCGGPADTNGEGTLWLLQDHRGDWPDWPHRMGCTEPPVCADCATLSVRSCPALRNGYVLARVRHAPVAVVHGALYGRSPVGTVKALTPITARFDDPVILWVLASHLVRELRQVTLLTRSRGIRFNGERPGVSHAGPFTCGLFRASTPRRALRSGPRPCGSERRSQWPP